MTQARGRRSSEGPLPPPSHERGAAKGWRAGELRLLGRLVDREVARRTGRTERSVSAKRKQLGIPERPQGRAWTAAELRELERLVDAAVAQLAPRRPDKPPAKRTGFRHSRRVHARILSWLGKVSDMEIARRVGLSNATISNLRRKLGITCSPRMKPFTNEEKRLLGKDLDKNVARRLGRTTAQVCRERQMLGIPPVRGPRKNWSKEEEALLGKLTDEELARRFGRTYDAIQVRRAVLGIRSPQLPAVWTAREVKLLGKAPDAVIARKLNRGENAVRSERLRQGIPAFQPPRAGWKPEEVKLFGRLTDLEIAAQTGKTLIAVASKRLRLGLARQAHREFQDHREAHTPTPWDPTVRTDELTRREVGYNWPLWLGSVKILTMFRTPDSFRNALSPFSPRGQLR